MKQVKPRSGKKWIWIVAGLVLLLAIAGVVLAMVLGGGAKANIPMEGRPDLYWNIDRLTYLKNSMTGQTSRQPAEDGLYHIRFAYNGEQIELTTADKALVHQIDTMDIMGLELDKDGKTITKAVAATKVAKEIGAPIYVQRTAGNVIIVNASAALNAVSMELTLTENTQIYDVNPEAETIGAICTIDDIGSADALYVYGNGSDEITHVYLVSHPVRSPLYWAAERKYSSANKATTREPDENGIYTVTAFSEGEKIDLKFKDVELVNQIDKKNKYSLHFGVTMDQDGFVIQILSADEALGGTSPADRWFVTEVNGSNVKVQKFGTSPKEYTFTLPEDCPIYDVSLAAQSEGRQGQLIDSLEWGDRITMWVDGNDKPIMIYVSNAMVEDVTVYYSPERKYSTKDLSTTREPNSQGHYELELYKTGDSGLTNYVVKDKALMDLMDSMSMRMFGLIVDEENVVQRVYYPESIFGYTQFTTGRTVDAIIGPFVTCITIGKPMDTLNAAMSTACEVYNVSGYGDYGRTMLEVGDHITANRGFDGYNDTDIMRIFVARKLLGKDMMYFILDHSYDSTLKESTRKIDEDGWYRIPVAHNGQQMVVRTRSKAMLDKMESFSPGAVCLELSGDVVVGAYDPAWGTGGKKVTSGYRIVSFGESNTLSANYKTTTTEIELAEDVVYYNVSDAYYDHKGEETSYLTLGDQITAFTNRHGKVEVVYVRGRETKGMYWHVNRMYDSKTKQTTRTPDAEGWYYIDLLCDGVIKTYKTKNFELASKVDSYETGFGLVVQGDVILSCVTSTWVDDVSSTAASNWDVIGVDGNTITIQYNLPGSTKTGTTTTLRMNSATKVYDVSLTAEQFGAPATIKVGDRIRAYGSETYADTLSYVYIMTHDTRKDGQLAYCEHCQKEVFWNPWRGENFSKGDAHYYLNADMETNKQISIYNEDLDYEVVLDLNGNTYHVEGKRGFAVYRGETMTVMDSVGGGCLSATGATGGYGGVFTLVSKGTLNLLSGTIKGVAREDQTIAYGGTLYSSSGTINIYGGEIIGGVVKADETLGKTTPYGGAIMTSGATVNMYGGKISGGRAENYTYGVVDEAGKPVIDEATGKQQMKTNDGRGGNVYITGSTFNMYGGEIVDGNASHGGNIYVSNSTFNMAGGKISGGVATNGGNAYVYSKGKLITSGDALITGGTSTRAASRNNGGGNVFVYLTGAVMMEGGSIVDGTAVSYGGNITCRGGELVIKDGVISGGKSETGGDNVYINGTEGAKTMFVAAGGKIVDGNVYIHKPAEEGRINAGLTGAPVIEELDLTSGAIFEMYEMKKGADVTVNGAGTLSAPYKQAQAYVDAGYIKHIDDSMVIKAAEDDTLFVAQYCEHCGKEVQWINWNGEMLNTADTVNGGHYVLMKDINTSSQIRIGADATDTAEAVVVDVCINLNGHSITNKARAFAVYAGSTLSLVNNSETESVVEAAYDRDIGGVINLSSASNLNLYGNIVLESFAEDFTSRGGIVHMNTGTFNMYGGTLNGQKAASGGAVYVNGGTFNMYDGLITGGSATSSGGNLYLNGGEINISGGLVENGFADGSASSSNGGNIYIAKGELNVSGDAVITGGTGTRSAARTNGGGNIYGQDNTVINISGGQILNGTATSFGGNVYGRGEVNISGGLISGGTAANGGNVFVSGYSVPATLTVTGGTIENGTATTGELDNLKAMVKEAYDGDNIYITSATANITGGKITDNDGGNAILAFTSNADRPGVVILTLADNEGLIVDLDAKVYAVSGAQIVADQGGLKADTDGDKIWCIEGYDEEAPTEPSTVPTKPSEPSEPSEPVDTEHECPHCGQVVTWTEWSGEMLNTADTVNGGHYILTKDVNTSSQIRVGADATDTAEAIVVSVCVDLNGHNITNNARAFAVYAGSTLTLVNSGNKESVVTGAYNRDVGGVINLGGASNLNLYGNIVLESFAEDFTSRGGIVHMNTGTFNMYGGTIEGRVAASGGAIYVNGGKFNMYDGVITGGSATSSGGNIYLNGGEITISGGRVENGLADGSASSSNGGNIYLAKGKLTVSGGTITGGNATRSATRNNGGGNIYGQDNTTIIISGGEILDGSAVSFGGNLLARGTVEMTGGTISGGSATNGGNVFMHGYAASNTQFTMTGGTIENGTSVDNVLDNVKLGAKANYNGDNIFATSAKVNISGGRITDDNGGNAILAVTSKTEHPAIVSLTLADNAELAEMLDGKVYLVEGATINTDIGGVATDADGDMIWYKVAPSVEPTEPSTEPTQPEETTAPTQPEETTAPTQPEETTAPTEPSQPQLGENVCPHCEKEVVWTEWTGGYLNTADKDGGHYILTKDVTSSGQIVIGASAKADNAETPDVDETADAVVVEVCVNLNGYSITKPSRTFAVYAGSTLTLVNTAEKESAVTGAYSLADNGNVIVLWGESNLNLYGNIRMNTTLESFGYKGGVVYMETGTFTMCGGTMEGCRATSGGAIYVNGGKFNMTGGTITGGSASSSGGNIYLNGGEINISGGRIENGFADGSASSSNGGNIYINKGTLNVLGGTITGGNATRAVARTNGGGNIYGQDKTVINISGGTIENGTTVSFGGNAYCRGALTITGGMITGGTAVNGGNVFVSGYSYADATLNITGGTIQNGTATTGELDNLKLMVKEAYNGDNIYLISATANITGGTITDDNGGNAILAFTSKDTNVTTVNLQLAENAQLAEQLDGKVYLVTGATVNADIGGVATDADGDMIWYKVAPSVEPTEPSVEPSQPEETTAPTEPSTEATEPSTEPVETCPHCGEEVSKITYEEWSTGSGGTATESGHYYLSATVEGIKSQLKIGTNDTPVDIFLDLRGNSLKATNVRIFTVYAGSTLTIVDTVGGGELQGGGDGSNVINLTANATFNLYDATLTNVRATESTNMGGVVNTTDGTAETPSVFNMYSGTLNGGNHAGNGGAVVVRKYAQFNMYGGVINGATCTTEGKTPSGAAIGTRDKTSVVRIYGGTVNAGVSEGQGDCVYVVAGATFVVEGGNLLGGDVCVKTVGENAVVLSGEVTIDNLNLTAGGIITLGKGGVTGTIKVNGAEGVICAAGENTADALTCFQSLNGDLEPAVNGDGQIVLVAKAQPVRAIVKPFSANKSRRLFA